MKDTFLGIPFYRYYYDREKLKEVQYHIKNLNYRRNNGDANYIWDGVKEDGGCYLHKLNCFEDLFLWFQECLDEVANDMKIKSKLIIHSSWANKNKPGDYFHEHIHRNAFISSNFYVTGHSKDKTIWYHPNPYFHSSNIYPCGLERENYFLIHEEETEPGKYVVFPPTIPHRAQINTANYDRITIACDIFPTGIISNGYTSHLNLNVIN